MKKSAKSKKNAARTEKARLIAIVILSLLVISTGALFAVKSFMKGEITGGIIGIVITATIFGFAMFTFISGNRDLKAGYPLKDERNRRVTEKATSKAFLISLYLLLVIGFLSDGIIKFRDVSQATSTAIGGMAVLFLIIWAYYNKKEI